MHGYNKDFKGSYINSHKPKCFLDLFSLRIQPPDLDGEGNPNPTYDLRNLQPPSIAYFDLRPYIGGVGVELFPDPGGAAFMDRFRGAKGFATRIKAYWLNYKPGKACRINLGTAANFLFTPMLSGCYIGIGGGAVTHVAGDMPGGITPADMRRHAENALGCPPTIGFNSDFMQAPLATFVGVRGTMGWAYYVQGHDMFYGKNSELMNLFDHKSNFAAVRGVNGRHLIELRDLALG